MEMMNTECHMINTEFSEWNIVREATESVQNIQQKQENCEY